MAGLGWSALKALSQYPIEKANNHTEEQLRNMLIILKAPMDDDSPVGFNDTFRLFFFFRGGVIAHCDYAVLGK